MGDDSSNPGQMWRDFMARPMPQQFEQSDEEHARTNLDTAFVIADLVETNKGMQEQIWRLKEELRGHQQMWEQAKQGRSWYEPIYVPLETATEPLEPSFHAPQMLAWEYTITRRQIGKSL